MTRPLFQAGRTNQTIGTPNALANSRSETVEFSSIREQQRVKPRGSKAKEGHVSRFKSSIDPASIQPRSRNAEAASRNKLERLRYLSHQERQENSVSNELVFARTYLAMEIDRIRDRIAGSMKLRLTILLSLSENGNR